MEQPKRKPKRSTVRWRAHWKKIKFVRRTFCSAIVGEPPGDALWLCANVEIFYGHVVGLFNTEASVSCISGVLAEKLLQTKFHRLDRVYFSIQTADGHKLSAVGTITTTVTFRGQSKTLLFIIVPALSQNLYLGMDFVNSFALATDLVSKNWSASSEDAAEMANNETN